MMAFQVAQRRAVGCPIGSSRPVSTFRRAPISDRRSCIVAVADITSEAEFEQEVLKVKGMTLMHAYPQSALRYQQVFAAKSSS